MKRAAAALAAAAALLLAATGNASNSTTYYDSASEAPGIADISSTVVSNDDAGNVTIKVNVADRPVITPDMAIVVFFDTDKNPATGGPGSGVGVPPGSESYIDLSSAGFPFYVWNGTMSVLTTSPSVSASYAAGSATFRLSTKDLGNTKSFNFAVASGAGLGSAGTPAFDLAPNSPKNGLYTYDVKIAPTLTAAHLTETPKAPTHGKPFSVHLAAT